MILESFLISAGIGSGNSLIIAFDVTVFPQPDSPTIAKVSPLSRWKSTPLTAFTSPA